MKQDIAHITLVVENYDDAIDFYVNRLGFELVEDTELPEQNKRWVLVKPQHSGGTMLLLAQASDEDQKAAIGNQTGGRVFLFLKTDDFWHDFNRYTESGVEFVREPQQHDYGVVAVFADLYGNLWDLIQYNSQTS